MDINNRYNHYTFAVANMATAGPLATAAQLGNASSFNVTQTTAGIAATLPVPENVRGKVRVWVSNDNTSTQTFTAQGTTIPIGGEVEFYYDTAWHAKALPLRKFSVQQALVAGNNTITHNFGLATPFAVVSEVRDVTTGNKIDCNIIPGSRTTNTVILNVGVAITNAEITLFG
jgi:hypothetical protein